MENGIFQKDGKPYRAVHSFKLVFKPGVFEEIMRLKGWRDNAQCAKEMLFTRQYVSMVRRGVCSVSTDFILRLIELTNNHSNDRWSEWFLIVPTGREFNPRHQLWNNAKHNGEMPYASNGDSAPFRSKDADIETE